MKKYKPLYDPATDSLKGLTDSEHRMIAELAYSPPNRAKNILEQYFENSNDKHLFFLRTDEILSWYYRWGSININPFSFKQEKLEQLIEHLDALSNHKEKLNGNQIGRSLLKSTDKPMAMLNLATLIRPFSKWHNLRQILVDQEILTKQFLLNLKGNGWKKRTIFLINELDRKNYFDKRLNSDEIEMLVKGSFNVTITRRYVDKVFATGEQSDEFKFIPDSFKIS